MQNPYGIDVVAVADVPPKLKDIETDVLFGLLGSMWKLPVVAPLIDVVTAKSKATATQIDTIFLVILYPPLLIYFFVALLPSCLSKVVKA